MLCSFIKPADSKSRNKSRNKVKGENKNWLESASKRFFICSILRATKDTDHLSQFVLILCYSYTVFIEKFLLCYLFIYLFIFFLWALSIDLLYRLSSSPNIALLLAGYQGLLFEFLKMMLQGKLYAHKTWNHLVKLPLLS